MPTNRMARLLGLDRTRFLSLATLLGLLLLSIVSLGLLLRAEPDYVIEYRESVRQRDPQGRTSPQIVPPVVVDDDAPSQEEQPTPAATEDPQQRPGTKRGPSRPQSSKPTPAPKQDVEEPQIKLADSLIQFQPIRDLPQ